VDVFLKHGVGMC